MENEKWEKVVISARMYRRLIESNNTLRILQELWNSGQDLFTVPEFTKFLMMMKKENTDD